MDRIDIRIEVPAPREADLLAAPQGEPSSAIRARVLAARERQLARQMKVNARLDPHETERHCTPDHAGEALVRQAIARLGLSARAYHRVLRVARSIADWPLPSASARRTSPRPCSTGVWERTSSAPELRFLRT